MVEEDGSGEARNSLLLMPPEVICDDMAGALEESPARAHYAAVRLRLRGQKDAATACVKVETLPCAVTVARDGAEEVKVLKKKLWHMAREKTKLEQSCEGAIRGIKSNVKARSREALRALASMSQELELAGSQMRRLRHDNNYLRKVKYTQENTIEDLAQRLADAEKRAAHAEAAARASDRTAALASAACTKATAAYKARAGAFVEMKQERRKHRADMLALQRGADASAALVDAGQQQAADLRQRADAAEARERETRELARAAESSVAEAHIEIAVHAQVGEGLYKEIATMDSELNQSKATLEKARAKIAELDDRVKELTPPEFYELEDATSSRSQRRWVQQDINFLTNVFSERTWRVDDVARALADAGLLTSIFDSKEVWTLRLRWLDNEMKILSEEQWSVDNTIGLMIDAVLSFGDLQRLRMAFSLAYSADHDRAMHKVWVTCPKAAEPDDASPSTDAADSRLRKSRFPFVRLPEPIAPVEKVRKRFKELEADLKIEISDDGRIATHRFMDRLLALHEEHKALGLIHPACGTTPELAHNVTYALDAFPVEAISVEHSGIFSSSLVVPSQSEDFFRVIAAATIKENNAELNRMHAMRKVDVDFNRVSTSGFAKGTDGKRIYFNLLICCDKKAVEVLRGCSPGCAWCICGRENRLASAWPVRNEPKTWAQALKALTKVCTGAFPEVWDIYAWAHLALPGEKVPAYCNVCKKKPYKDEAEYKAHLKEIVAMRRDTSKEGKARWKAKRAAHAGLHHGQYLHEASNFMYKMINCIPEVMHLDGLNVAKQSWTKGAVVLLNEYMQEVASGFFKGMGVKLDVKTKPDGRAGTAWFKASVWAELVHGFDNVPGGLPGWFSSLLFFVGQDFVAKQGAFVASQAAADATTDEVMKRAFGVKGQNLLDCARLFDAYKDWHDALHMDTPDAGAREKVALELALTANRLMVLFKAVAKETGKTWVFHIALFIVPRTVHK